MSYPTSYDRKEWKVTQSSRCSHREDEGCSVYKSGPAFIYARAAWVWAPVKALYIISIKPQYTGWTRNSVAARLGAEAEGIQRTLELSISVDVQEIVPQMSTRMSAFL
jgi:hypothetical protein